MNKLRGDVIQAMTLIEGQINKGVGTYEAKGVIHAEVATTINLPFPSGTVSYSMAAGDDRGYIGKFEVVSGSVTYE